MTMLQFVMRILILALPLCANASASTAISDPSLDDQAEGAKASASVPSTWSEPTTTVVEVTIPPAVAPSTTAARAERVVGANPLWAMPLKQFSITRDRPIFSPSRRAPAPAASAMTVAKVVVPKPKEPEQLQLSLVGTIVSDEDKFGIFVDQSTKAVIRLRVGEDFHGWKLQQVQGRETAFKKNQQTFVVALPQPSPVQASVTVRSEPAAPDNIGNPMPPNTRFRHDR